MPTVELVPRRGRLVQTNPFFGVANGASCVQRVVLQKQGPFLVGRRVQEEFFLFQRKHWSRVVSHDVGQGDVACAREQVGHECSCLSIIMPEQRDHLAFCVAVGKKDVPSLNAHGVVRDSP